MSDIVSRETSGDELDDSAIVREALGEAYDKLEVFHVKLSREGELRGLIGPRDISIIWERHILNSAACVPFIREVTDRSKAKTIADVGSGGGFLESLRQHACRIVSLHSLSPWNVVSNGCKSAWMTWTCRMLRLFAHVPTKSSIVSSTTKVN